MFKVSVQGINGVKAQFLAATEDMKVVIEQEMNAMGQDWVSGAVRDCPKDQGALAGSISYIRSDTNTASGSSIGIQIVAQIFYAPFMEFGTKGKYLPIPGTENIAAQFRGFRGGDFGQMIKFIELWVSRKGITGTYSVKTRKRTGGKALITSQNKQAAFAIALSILRHGVTPHPFFFKQQEVVWPVMVKRIKERIERGSRVSVIMSGDISRPKIVTI